MSRKNKESPKRLPMVVEARVHMLLEGADHTFAVPVRTGPSTLCHLLTSAKKMADLANEVVLARAEGEGKSLTCTMGCGACCREAVAISAVEALDVAHTVAAMPEERQSIIRARFSEALARLEAASVIGPKGARNVDVDELAADDEGRQALRAAYFRAGVACPFLENESCSIYEVRPVTCREHLVTSPVERCRDPFVLGVDMLGSLNLELALGRLAKHKTGIPSGRVLLILALEWAEQWSHVMNRRTDGRALFAEFMAEAAKAGGEPR